MHSETLGSGKRLNIPIWATIIVILAVLTAIVWAGGAFLGFGPVEWHRKALARQAVDRVVDACKVGNKLLFDSAMLDAESAIRRLSVTDAAWEDDVMSSRLAMYGCQDY